MIAKKYKLPVDLFPKTAKTVFRDDFFVAKKSENRLGVNRVGVTFKSKAFKTAALRNKLKRFFFDYVRNTGFLDKKNNVGEDLLIILNPPIISLSESKLQEKLKQYDQQFI